MLSKMVGISLLCLVSCGRVDHRASGETTHTVNTTVEGEAKVEVEINVGAIEEVCAPLVSDLNKYSKCIKDITGMYKSIAESAGEE